MAEMILEFSNSYLKKEIANAFVENADCSNVYTQPITAGTTTYYVDHINIFKTAIKSGKTVQTTLEQGQTAISTVEVLVDLVLLVYLVDKVTVLAGGTTLLTLPLLITIKLEAKPSSDSSSVNLTASFDSVTPSTLNNVNLNQAFKSKIKDISVELPVGSLSKFPLSVRNSSIKLLDDGNLALRVTIQDNTSASDAYTEWVAFWNTYTTAKYLTSADDWAVLQGKGLMEYLAKEEFQDRLPDMQKQGFNPDGDPSVSWLPDEQKLYIYGEGEVEVPVCPDVNVWYDADLTFQLQPAPTLVVTTCIDGGLTASGKAEAVLCGALAVLTGSAVGGFVLGPLGAILAGLGTTITSIVLGVQFTGQAIGQIQKCTTTTTTLSFNGLTAQWLSYHTDGLVVGGKSTTAYLGDPQMKTDALTIKGSQWVIPECAGNDDYAPWNIENTGKVGLIICKFESIPAFNVLCGGYQCASGEYAGIVLEPGEKETVKALGSGQLIVYTNAGICSILIEKKKKPAIQVVVTGGVDHGKIKFGASYGVPYRWLCSGLKNVKKYVKIPIKKQVPDHDVDRFFLPVLPQSRSFAVYDALINNAWAGTKMTFVNQTENETAVPSAAVPSAAVPSAAEVATYAGESRIRHLNLSAPKEGDLWLTIDPGQAVEEEAEPGLRLSRFTLTLLARVRPENNVRAFTALGKRLYMVDSGSLWSAELGGLRGEDGVQMLAAAHWLSLDQSDGNVSLTCAGRQLFLTQPGELVSINSQNPEIGAIRGFSLSEEVSQSVMRGGKLYLVMRGGIEILDVQNPSEIRSLERLDIENANGLCFSGRFAYISTHEGFHVVRLEQTTGQPYQYLDTRPTISGMSMQGRSLYLHTQDGGSLIFNCCEPLEPHLAGEYKAAHWSQGMMFKSDYAYRLSQGMVEIYRITQDAPVMGAIEDFMEQ
jgi:hypothetical protein